jgi:hypothetical protein
MTEHVLSDNVISYLEMCSREGFRSMTELSRSS